MEEFNASRKDAKAQRCTGSDTSTCLAVLGGFALRVPPGREQSRTATLRETFFLAAIVLAKSDACSLSVTPMADGIGRQFVLGPARRVRLSSRA